MREIVIRAGELSTPDEFYAAFLDAVGAPPWHGRNLDVVWDSITKGDINQINPPFRLRIVGTAEAPEPVLALVHRFAELIEEANADGVVVEAVCES